MYIDATSRVQTTMQCKKQHDKRMFLCRSHATNHKKRTQRLHAYKVRHARTQKNWHFSTAGSPNLFQQLGAKPLGGTETAVRVAVRIRFNCNPSEGEVENLHLACARINSLVACPRLQPWIILRFQGVSYRRSGSRCLFTPLAGVTDKPPRVTTIPISACSAQNSRLPPSTP